MSLHLDIVVDNPQDADDRRQQSIRLLGEILPFVLAKYQGGGSPPRNESRWELSAAERRAQHRFSDDI